MNTQTFPAPKQYLVAEDGRRVGVVLDWEAYQHLQAERLDDPDLLHDLSEGELKLLAEGMLAMPHQTRLKELLQRNQTSKLSQKESQELDELLARVDLMNTLKARALYTLQQQG